MLLAIDTSGALVSVALHDGKTVVAQRNLRDARHHAELLIGLVAQAHQEVDLAPITRIAVGVGPGPFTGLRVGMTTAAVLGYAWQVPVGGGCSLDALAGQVFRAGLVDPAAPFLVTGDARRKELYWAGYAVRSRSGVNAKVESEVSANETLPAAAHRMLPLRVGGETVLLQRLSGPAVNKPEVVAQTTAELSCRCYGFGMTAYRDTFAADHQGEPVDVTAADIAQCATDLAAADIDLLPLVPLYLRMPDAVPQAARKTVSQ